MDQIAADIAASPAEATATAPAASIQAPSRFRALVRGGEIGLVAVGWVAGALAGLLVTAIAWTAQMLHVVFFLMSTEERLSGLDRLASPWLALMPAAGGAVLGLILFWFSRRKTRPLVDPIEANALHGGRMSIRDSLIVVLQNLVSNGFGASVGLEAAYTQISAGLASRIGLSFELRRGDLRTLVGCGAAGAIAAAFNAPLTGAFYAFELIIGTYSIATLAPVVAAALSGVFVARLFVGSAYLIEIDQPGVVSTLDYAPALVLAILAAGLGILVMKGVTSVEAGFRRSRLPAPLRPLVGGLLLGGLALVTPQVLSSGHGALHVQLDHPTGILAIATLLILKAVASAISIGSGFRGGLFFASLFLGALLGKLFAEVVPVLFPDTALAPIVFAVVGMSALAASIIGGPLTMTFLALEMTGDFPITALVLAAVVTSSLTVRRTFGYSFATWRFHLRGESIRSAHDVGWIRNLTVGRMMRRDVRTVPADTPLKTFRRNYPLGSAQRVVAIDPASGAYAGIVLVPDAYADGIEDLEAPVSTLLRFTDAVLRPAMTARDAMTVFDAAESEALAVVDGGEAARVIGLLTESHVLRRYSEELETRRREVSGEGT
ncbi:chloride channel protein [Antarcticirhabdus aurantiaca]|uniref:Chloride channel protein n=1 Tax=Antarcticirhabdus aurantiaca TaxID=2606717 RepID=A0ACD4NI32_9HYPH|nr:chloride channel protein [Antarcticirhabdus aurantiaca]WAJ26497.1 chloride channel protein [Jeongeuplla avenae]